MNHSRSTDSGRSVEEFVVEVVGVVEGSSETHKFALAAGVANFGLAALPTVSRLTASRRPSMGPVVRTRAASLS